MLCAYQISSVDYDLLPITADRVMDVQIQSKPYHVRFRSSILPRVTYCKLNEEPGNIQRAFRTLHAFNPHTVDFVARLTRKQIARTYTLLFSIVRIETISGATRLNVLVSRFCSRA